MSCSEEYSLLYNLYLLLKKNSFAATSIDIAVSLPMFVGPTCVKIPYSYVAKLSLGYEKKIIFLIESNAFTSKGNGK